MLLRLMCKVAFLSFLLYGKRALMLFAVLAGLAGWGVAVEVSQVQTWPGSASTPSGSASTTRDNGCGTGCLRGNLPQPQPSPCGATSCLRCPQHPSTGA